MKAKHIFIIVILFFCGFSLNAQNQALDFLKAKPHDGDPTIEETVSWLNENWLSQIFKSEQLFPFIIDNEEMLFNSYNSNPKFFYSKSFWGDLLQIEFCDNSEPKTLNIFLNNINQNTISKNNGFITLSEWLISNSRHEQQRDQHGVGVGIGFVQSDGCSKVSIKEVKEIQIPISNYKYKSHHWNGVGTLGTQFEFEKVNFNVSSSDHYILKNQIILAFNYIVQKTTGINDECWYGACLLGETKISSNKNMFESIDKVKINDSITSYSTQNKQYFQTTITAIDSVYHNNLVELQYENDTITCTDDHPFFIENKGWCSLNPEKTMRNYSNYPKVNLLEKGDSFLSSSGSGITTIKLEDIKFLTKGEMTYTITGLKKGNTYFANGILTGVEILENPF